MNELNNSSLKGLSRDKHGRVLAASVSGSGVSRGGGVGSFLALPQPSPLYKSHQTTPDGEQKHRKDKQRKRSTHRSKKTGRRYTHRPGEDIAPPSFDPVRVDIFNIFYIFSLFFPYFFFFQNCLSTCHMRIRGL